MAQDQFMPILFQVLFGFVILNMLINFSLLMIQRKRMFMLLSALWPSVLIMFYIQSRLQTNPFEIALGYLFCTLNVFMVAMIAFEAIGRSAPIKQYFLITTVAAVLMLLLHHYGFSFTIYIMPVAIAIGLAPLHASFYLLIIDRKISTRLQKLLGIVTFLMFIHSINFALFRIEPGAQLWGWLVAYALYDMLAILLPSIALEDAKIKENEILQKAIADKTAKLEYSGKLNDGLLKVLIHDVANPLMVMKYYTQNVIPATDNAKEFDKVIKSIQAIEDIIGNVKNQYLHKTDDLKIPLSPINLAECFAEVAQIFSQPLLKKNISLKFNNQLPLETTVMADRASLTHSVLSNLISNGVKFSESNSSIEVNAREEKGLILIEVKDFGSGIPKDIKERLLKDSQLVSTAGTQGEQGSGLGLSIVKSFIDAYGGEVKIESRHLPNHPVDHGTSVLLLLKRA